MSCQRTARVPEPQTDPVDRYLRPFFGDEICRFLGRKCENIDLVAVSRMAPKTSTEVLCVCLSIDEQTTERTRDGSESPQHKDKIFKLLKKWKDEQPSGGHTWKNLVLCLIRLEDDQLMKRIKKYLHLLSRSISPNAENTGSPSSDDEAVLFTHKRPAEISDSFDSDGTPVITRHPSLRRKCRPRLPSCCSSDDSSDTTSYSTSTRHGTGRCVQDSEVSLLVNVLNPISPDWDLFSRQIGVPKVEIAKIKAANAVARPTQVSRCLTDAMDWWVENDPRPTYKKMVEALKGPSIGKKKLAEKVGREAAGKRRGKHQMESPENTPVSKRRYRRGERTTTLQKAKNALRALSRAPFRSVDAKLAHVSPNYTAWYRESLENPEKFWRDLGQSQLLWMTEFGQVMEGSMARGNLVWFKGGILNVSANCLDRHVVKDPDRPALLWEKDEPEQEETVTYKQLLDMTCQVANVLKKYGIRKRDRVVICMPTCPLAAASMLACARIGAVHCVVFTEFGPEALKRRIQTVEANAVITANHKVQRGRSTDLKTVIDQAVSECPSVRKVFVVKTTPAEVVWNERDVPLKEAMDEVSMECDPEPMDSEDMLLIIYTSGTSGSPRPIFHNQAGYLLWVAVTFKYVFDYQPGDVFGCVADLAWVAGQSYALYGPLCNGATTLLFEGTLDYPHSGRYWETVQRLGITHFCSTPSSIQQLMKAGDGCVLKYDRSKLKVLITAGEPITEEAWDWYYRVVGDSQCTIIDHCGQTECSGLLLATQPATNRGASKPCFSLRPFFGVDLVLLDDSEGSTEMKRALKEVKRPGDLGWLCIRTPFPGMAGGIYNSQDEFLTRYFEKFPNVYFTGDVACYDKQNCYRIIGREGGIISRRGLKLARAEIENILSYDCRVSEVAVVGYSDIESREGIFAFVVLESDVEGDETEAVKLSLRSLVKRKIGKVAMPDEIQFVENLPKTHSKKTMHCVLRFIASLFAKKMPSTSQPQTAAALQLTPESGPTPSSPTSTPSPTPYPDASVSSSLHYLMSSSISELEREPTHHLQDKLKPAFGDMSPLSNPLSVIKMLHTFGYRAV